jgi:hypothetical protein
MQIEHLESSTAVKQRVLELRARLGNNDTLYPNAGASAYCSFRSQTVHLLNTKSKLFKEAIKSRTYLNIRKDIQDIFHEVTHWCDCLGSLWGQQHLLKIFGAYDVLLNNRPESEFWAAIVLHDAERRILYPAYYHTVETSARSASANEPWQLAYSVGREFNPYGHIGERPILFIRFLDHYTGSVVVRQPITAGSLLETLAMWSEMRCMSEMAPLFPEDERIVEMALISKQVQDYLYNPRATVYTAPAHILSAACGIGEVYSTYNHGALLAQIALNFSHDLMSKLNIDGFSPETNDLFRKSADPGFVYVALCHRAPPSVPDAEPVNWLEETLANADLPTRREILEQASHTMDKLIEALPAQAEVPRHLFDIGRSLHKARSQEPDPGVTLIMAERQQLPFPPLFDADGEVLLMNDRFPDPSIWNAVEMLEAEAKLHTWVQNFHSACR